MDFQNSVNDNCLRYKMRRCQVRISAGWLLQNIPCDSHMTQNPPTSHKFSLTIWVSQFDEMESRGVLSSIHTSDVTRQGGLRSFLDRHRTMRDNNNAVLARAAHFSNRHHHQSVDSLVRSRTRDWRVVRSISTLEQCREITQSNSVSNR